jgi:ParB family transcriptional regulator, chromosome partitioning protein
MNTQTTTEYRNLPLAVLTESAANPRRVFDDAALKELAESIRVQGVLSPLLVRPITEKGFEIVAGARRYRAAQMVEAATVPVRIVNLTDAEALETALVENLIRADVHPMEEANGLRALLMLEEPKYTVEQLAAKIGKTPSFVASRVRLTELIAPAVEAFYAEEIGVGHALLLAKLHDGVIQRRMNSTVVDCPPVSSQVFEPHCLFPGDRMVFREGDVQRCLCELHRRKSRVVGEACNECKIQA